MPGKISPDTFIDTLTFTTEWKGGLHPVLELNPVDRALRLKHLDVKLDAGRKDVHTVTISLAVPDKRDFQRAESATVQSVLRLSRAIQYTIGAARDQAALNLCVALAKKREQEFGTLRLAPPEQYCTLYSSRVPQPGVFMSR